MKDAFKAKFDDPGVLQPDSSKSTLIVIQILPYSLLKLVIISIKNGKILQFT